MPAKRQWTAAQLEQIIKDFDSDLTCSQVGAKHGCYFNKSIKPFWIEVFGKEAVHNRFRKSCAKSKTGNLNPMFNNHREKHPLHKKEYVTTMGYRMVDVPDWWTGSTKASKYLEHIIVGCKKYGLTQPRKGYVFHHVDGDKLNNHPDNLEMMTIAEHMAHHKNATRKVQRLSRKGVGPKQARSALTPCGV